MRRANILLLASAAGALGLLVLLAPAGGAGAAYTTPGAQGDLSLDDIDANTTEVTRVSAAPAVFEVSDNLTVAAGDVLVVPAGTEVRFANDTGLTVFGGLRLEGTAAAPVVLRTMPHPSDEDWEWLGVAGDRSSAFVINHVQLVESLGLTYANGSGGVLFDVTYQGRLFLDNASDVTVQSLVMTPHPRDTGRPPFWLVNGANISIIDADLTSGYGWGIVPSVYLLDSQGITIRNLTCRIDNFQLPALSLERSRAVRVENFSVVQGPNMGVPGSGISAVDSEDVWIERADLPEGTPVGVLYGTNSSMTVANSTFLANTTEGVWAYGGTLIGLNATRLPARPEFGGAVWDFELVRVEARFAAGGPVAAGTARIENGSWNATAAVASGLTSWMWALRSVNDSGNLTLSTGYRADVTCNCTSGSANFTLMDGPAAVVLVLVGDTIPPVAIVTVAVTGTGEQGTLDASASFDNDAVAAWSWTSAAPNVTGLPCALAVCAVTFVAPGDFTVLLTLTDPAGNTHEVSVRVSIADVLPPTVRVTGVAPPRPGQNETFTVTAEAADNDPAFLPAVEWYLDGVRVPGGSLTQAFEASAIGNHTVRVRLTDDAGNSAEAHVTVYVRDSTPPVVGDWTAPVGLAPGAHLTLNGSVATDNAQVASWRWQVSGPGTNYSLTGPAPNATFPSPGTYLITLTASDAEGNQAARTWSVEVAAPPPTDGTWGLMVLVALVAAALVVVVAFALRKRSQP